MPAKGTRRIPTKEKAEIIAEGRLETASTVARRHGIAKTTVYSIRQKASQEVLALADDYHERIVEKAKKNVEAGLEAMHKKLTDPETPLRELTPAVKVNHDIVQLETGRPTEIVQEQSKMLKSLVEYCKIYANGPRQLAAMVLFADRCGIDESLRRAEAEKILLEATLTQEFNR